jgi:hypothetical protein
VDDARYLFIVNRGDHRVYQHAVRTFADSPRIQVIYDRREGDRRRAATRSPVERRQGGRRVRDRIDADIREYGAAMVRLDRT